MPTANYKSHRQAKSRNYDKANTRKELLASKCSPRNRRMHSEPMQAADVLSTYNLVAAQPSVANALTDGPSVPSHFALLGFRSAETSEFIDTDSIGPISWRDCDPNNPERTLIPMFDAPETD